MRHRPLWAAIVGLAVFAGAADAKVRDFQFIEDLSFAMPREFSYSQGIMRSETRRTVTNQLSGLGLEQPPANYLKATSVVPNTLTYGVSERFEIALEVPYVFLDNALTDYNGLGDVALRPKVLMSDQAGKDWLSSAFGMRIETPTGDKAKGLGNGKTDVEIMGILMKEFGFAKWLVNVGYNFIGGPLDNEFKYNGGVNAAVRPGLSFLMEFSGIAGARDQMYLAPGILIETRGISLRLGTQFGMNDDSFKYRWNFNLSNNF
ncbi:hypothetical protein HY522_08625 [bacterium]|nr:hypothetical protein [bacterium]